jgi:transposase
MKTNSSCSIPVVSQEGIRLEAIKMVLEGKRQVEVAKKFGVTRQAVSKWLKAYRKEGEKALKAKRRGRPKGRVLLAR